jgi:hypothetical protein
MRFPRLDALGKYVKARDVRMARGGRQEPGEDLHRGALAGTIRPEESDDLSLLHLERDVVHGGDGTVFFGQVLDADHWSGKYMPPLTAS